MVCVGMDVHRTLTQVAVIDETGEELSNRNFRNDPADLDAMLITHAHFDHIGDAVEIARDKGPQVVSIPETSHWLGDKGVDNLG